MDYKYNKDNDKGLILVVFKVRPELLHALDVYAINNHLNRSEAIRKAIADMIKTEANAVETLGRL